MNKDNKNLSPEEKVDGILKELNVHTIRMSMAWSAWQIIDGEDGPISVEQAATNIAKALGTPDIRLSDEQIIEMFRESTLKVFKRKEK